MYFLLLSTLLSIFSVCFISAQESITENYPKDVTHFIERYDVCLHFLGEISGVPKIDSARQLYKSLDQYCKGTDSNLQKLKGKYANNSKIMEELNSFDEIEPNKTSEESLCLPDEITFFSCTIKNGKKLSLCGFNSNELNDPIIIYKFGRKNKIELNFPNNYNTTINNNSLTYNHYFRSQTDYFLVNFTNNEYSYNVFKNYDGYLSNSISAGVTVNNLNAEKEYNFECKTIEEDNIHKLSSILNCNKENALGCDNQYVK